MCILIEARAGGRSTVRRCNTISACRLRYVLTRIRACSVDVAAPQCLLLHVRVQDRVAVIATAPLTTNEVSVSKAASSVVDS